jgi:hypothetical protein
LGGQSGVVAGAFLSGDHPFAAAWAAAGSDRDDLAGVGDLAVLKRAALAVGGGGLQRLGARGPRDNPASWRWSVLRVALVQLVASCAYRVSSATGLTFPWVPSVAERAVGAAGLVGVEVDATGLLWRW